METFSLCVKIRGRESLVSKNLHQINMTKEELWEAVLAQIQFNTSPANFATWFKKTEISSRDEDQIVVSVPNNFSKEWLQNKYHKKILKILHKLNPDIKDIEYKVDSSKVKQTPSPGVEEEQLKFNDFELDKDTNLNPRYTFENFVVGSFNELSHAGAWAVAKEPGSVYNPLFIYGGVGLGKTHLLQAIGNRVKDNFDKKIKYVSAEKFTSGVVSSIKNQKIQEFKSNFKNIDTLIIDDIQFLSGKEKTQEEFFHIFNVLYEKDNQIILSSDRPPKAISPLKDRLRSRFEGGMIADISLPDYETRMAILKLKIKEREVSIPEQILDYIANNVKDNIRELEGALNKLIAYKKLNNETPDLEVAKSLLKNLVYSSKKIITPDKIVKTVANFYGIDQEKLASPSRKREVVKPRQIAMYLLRDKLDNSYPSIGERFGDRDHTTVIYACEKIEEKLGKEDGISEEIDLINQKLKNN